MPANDRGTGPATSESPDPSANQSGQAVHVAPSAFFRVGSTAAFFAAADQDSAPAATGVVDEFEGEEDGIEDVFRRKLAGLRRMHPRDRAAALRAARLERLLSLRVLRERRAAQRRLRHALLQHGVRPP